MTPAEAVRQLDELDASDDAEQAHINCDAILVQLAPPEVQAACARLRERTAGWSFA